jgi:GMP synthase (glutamine-hydrolysing)
MILVIDFGSQTCHLIARRINDLGIPSRVINPEDVLATVYAENPAGIILSGGPSSVYEKNAPTIDAKLFSLGIPILGICYGWQLAAHLLGGRVEPSSKEYGPVQFTANDGNSLLYGFPQTSVVWESHGDSVTKTPPGFVSIGTTPTVAFAAVWHKTKKIFGIQFHPEVTHSAHGLLLLENFATRVCGLPMRPKKREIAPFIAQIKEQIGTQIVMGAFSGGTDSAVAGALVAKAVGAQFKPFYVDNGLMRDETLVRIKTVFPKLLGIPVEIIHAEKEFLKALKGITDPELKRKAIGKQYIVCFEKQLKKYPQATLLMQGTTYADFIHSKGTKNAAHIKSHHNVGGLPKDMRLTLLEPLKYFYTDQVRAIGAQLGLPPDVTHQQPFPGPGHAVRILGEVTKERLRKQKRADRILLEEMRKAGWYEKVFQCWTILTGTNSTAVKGDGRFYGEVVALRLVQTVDRMSVDWVYPPQKLLQQISSRIVNEVPEVSRVVLDITTKPPATMEWE